MGMSDKSAAQTPGAEKPLARLCYVDDSRTAAFVMRRMLEPHGYQIDYFQSAEPAVVALIQEDYDLLLTDLKVSSSGMDGDDLIRTLRQSGQPKLSQLPIIVITGSTDAEVLVKVYDAGANQVMTKPVDAEELDRHIRRLLFEGRGAGAERAPAESGAPQVTPLQSSTQPPADERREARDIPVLQATVVPLPDDDDTVSMEASAALSVDDGQEERLSLIERAVANEMRESPTAIPAAEGSSATSSGDEPPAEAAAQDTDKADSPAGKEPPEATPARDEFEEYDGEIEIIIDPEKPAGRRRRARPASHRDDDILYEINRYALDSHPPREPGRLRRLLSARNLLILVLLAGLGLAGLKGWQHYFDKGLPVQTTRVEIGEIYQSIVVPGHVVSKQQLAISSAREGRLVAVLVDEGDKVAAGQVLARLDDRDLTTHLQRVQSDLANAREDVSLAERTLQRLRDAHDKGAVAKRFVEDAEVKLRAAQARAGMAAEAAHNATLAMEKQKITAPFAGTITRRQAEIGQWVTPADTLFVLADESQREIEVRVDAADSSSIAVGQVVLVTSDAFPGLEWQETVTRIGTAAEQERSGNLVKIFISLGDQAPRLRLGQPVDAEIRTAWNPNAVKVPFEALLNRQGQTYVAVMEDGVVHMRPVVTGIEDFSMAEIRQGLEGGEEIILPRGHLLQDGDRVYRPGQRD